jgi:hypothetical protein
MWFKKKENIIEYTAENQLADNYLSKALNAVSQVFSRGSSGSFGVSPDGKRNYNQLFGYGETLAYTDYKGMYKRGGIANTVVAKLPKSCWRELPKIKNGDSEVLEDELLLLKKAKFFKAMERADIANRIGSFSVLFIGVPDGLAPDLPIGTANKDNFAGLYFNVYEEDGIEVVEWDRDPASPRYNKPLMYTLHTTVNSSSKLKGNLTSINVHYSRVIHLAEGSLSNSLEGCSSLEAPWNALTDKEKVRGSSGESYYRGARQKLALEVNEGAKISMDKDAKAALKENVENFQNGFEDTLRLNNMKANMLQPSVASPRDPFDVCVEEVAGTTGIPIRILTTKAGGSVTGSEDKATWNALVNDRQDHECTPWLLDSLSVLNEAGILDLPGNAEIEWAPQSSLSEKEAAETSKLKAEAFEKVTTGLSNVGGDEVLAESVLKAVGLEDIEIDNIDLGEDDDKLNKSVEVK